LDKISALIEFTPVEERALYDKMIMPWLDPTAR
jgi:hypothetical protein